MLSLGVTGAANAATGYLTDEDTLYSLNPQTMQLTQLGAVAAAPISTAMHSNGQLYGITAESEQVIQTYNLATGAGTIKGDPKEPDSPGEIFSALGSVDGVLYAASYELSNPPNGRLYTLDPDTGAASSVGSVQEDDALISLAGSCDGTLYGIDENFRLVTVNRTTAAHTVVGQLQPGLSINASPAIAFDHSTGTLYALAGEVGSGTDKIYTVDPATGTLSATTFQSGQHGSDPWTIAFDSTTACEHERSLSLTYKPRRERFKGRLSADNPLCAKGQEVSIVRGQDNEIGSAETNSRGRFKLSAPPKRGRYHAVAPASSGAYGACLEARSETVRLP